MSITISLAAALATLYWLRFCFRGSSWLKSAVKTGAVLLLALTAWLASAPALLTLALLLCALGDYLLSRDSEAQFMAGVGAFAAGHLAYVALFLSQPATALAGHSSALTGGLALALAVLGLVMARLLWRRAGEMRVPVMIYIPIILSMGVAALQLPASGPLGLVLPGALLFIASDFTLSMEMFVLREGHPLRRITPFLVWPTYWGAQLLFTLAFLG